MKGITLSSKIDYVVGMLLVVAASGTATGLLTSLLGMTVYGVVFAFPFVILSLFPSSLEKLPKSGIWMEKAKVIFGFIELAAAVKFLWVPDLEWGLGILPRSIVLGLFLIIGFALILYLAGLFSFEKHPRANEGSISYIGIIITSVFLLPIGLGIGIINISRDISFSGDCSVESIRSSATISQRKILNHL